MTITNTQFTVAVHIMTALAYHHGTSVTSGTLAQSVNADPSFVRRTIAKLSKAGLVDATRGKNGACVLARSPVQITLLDVYRASGAPFTFAIHTYPVEATCPISNNIKSGLGVVLNDAQSSFERSLEGRTLADVVWMIQNTKKCVVT